MSDSGAIAPLDLAIGVMGLLHKGRRTATYKLATLSGLILLTRLEQRVTAIDAFGLTPVDADHALGQHINRYLNRPINGRVDALVPVVAFDSRGGAQAAGWFRRWT